MKVSTFRKMSTVWTVLGLAAAVALAGLVFTACDGTGSPAVNPEVLFAFDAATGTVTGFNEGQGARDITIPSTIGEAAVTAIGDQAFITFMLEPTPPGSNQPIRVEINDHQPLTRVVIPDSVTTIGYQAFENNALTSVTFGSGVTTIGFAAFRSNRLTSVEIPDSVTRIEPTTFASNNLTSVVIPDSVTDIGPNAFTHNNLGSVTIGSSVALIGDNAFRGNPITTVTVRMTVAEADERFGEGWEGRTGLVSEEPVYMQFDG